MPPVIPVAMEMGNQRGTADNEFIVHLMNNKLIALKIVTAGQRAAKLGKGIEVVEQGGDTARVDLVHDQLGPLAGGDHVHLADTALDARYSGWRHRQLADASLQYLNKDTVHRLMSLHKLRVREGIKKAPCK